MSLVFTLWDIGVFAILAVCPGAWLAFSLPLGILNWKTRVAIAVSLSPAIVEIEVLLLKSLGINFGMVATSVFIINLPAIMMILRNLPPLQMIKPKQQLLFLWVVLSIIVAYVVLPWYLIPNYRAFSWHALMHTDIVYAITSAQLLPEQPTMAGLTLAYPWVGHAFWSVLGWLTNRPPTFLYPFTNLLWLFMAIILVYEVVKTGLKLHYTTALFCVGLFGLGTNIIGAGGWLWASDRHWQKDVLGDIRYTPLLAKFMGFETMPFAFALLLSLMMVCVVATQQPIKLLWVIVAALLIALGLTYPILFPIGYCLVGCLLLLLLLQWTVDIAYYKPRELILLVIACAVSAIVVYSYLKLITQDITQMAVQFAQAGRKAKLLQLSSALFPFVLAAIPFVIRTFWLRLSAGIMLTTVTLFAMTLFVFTRFGGGNEYKYILAATLTLVPLSSSSLNPVFLRWPQSSKWMIVLSTLFLTIINLLLMSRTGALVPNNLSNAPLMEEASFWLNLNPSDKNAGWIQAVRGETPKDTILVAHGLRIHAVPFVERSLYFPSEAEGALTAGYSLDTRHYFLSELGYSEAVWEERQNAIETFYGTDDSAKLAAILRIFQSLNRPLAIHFFEAKSPALRWLKQEKIGLLLFTDANHSVWFIDRPKPSESSQKF